MTNQFNPEFQFMGGLINPTVGASSFDSFSRLQGNPADVHKQLYSFTGDYNDNVFEDYHHQDAFLQHIYEVFRDETEPSVESNQPFAGMAAPYKPFYQLFQTSWEKTLEDQQIDFKMLSEPVIIFTAAENYFESMHFLLRANFTLIIK